jgi:hypothetical protein
MPISAIFANAHLKKNNFCAVLRALGHQGLRDPVGCFAYKLGLKVIWLNLDSWV